MIQKLSVSLRLKIGIGEKIMANNEFRKLPVGIQSFNVIREEGYLYVDKTDIIWNLANKGRQYNFLIRPRRFGTGQIADAMKTLKALVADVPYSNKKLASMDMEERYRLIISTILNAIGLKVEVEHMLATGRIDLIAQTSRYIYVIELKLKNNGGKKAAIQQILDNKYLEPFMADKRKVIGLGIELDEEGKGLLDWGITDF